MAQNTDDTQRIELVAETARLNVQLMAGPRVLVRTETWTESQTLTAELDHVRVEVTRVPVGRDVDAAPEVRVEGEVTIIPVVEERVVIRLQLVLKEELHVRRVVETRCTEVPVSVRRDKSVIEHIDAHTGKVLH